MYTKEDCLSNRFTEAVTNKHEHYLPNRKKHILISAFSPKKDLLRQ